MRSNSRFISATGILFDANLTPQAGWRKGQYFLFTLTLVKIETMEAWKSQVEIQKVSRRGLFGW